MNDGGPAFPVPNYVNVDGDTFESEPSGMSLRDWFAGQALAGMLAGPDMKNNLLLGNPDGRELEAWMAEQSYEYADAMLKAREKDNG
jgi:hypothetical protein